MDHALLLDIFKTSLLTRRFEARIIQMAMAGELPGALHAGAGQEVGQVAPWPAPLRAMPCLPRNLRQ